MKKNKKKMFLAAVVLTSILVFSWSPAFAQYKNQEKIPGPGGEQTSDFPTYLKQIINFGFATIGILALWMIVIGAYQYLMAAGNIGKVDSAKETIGSALLGLILGLCAWIILYKINPDLVKMDLSRIQGLGGEVGAGILPGSLPRSIAGKVIASEDEMRKLYDPLIEKYAKQEGVDPNAIRALIAHESKWNREAISPTNDYGLMQINQSSHSSFFSNGNWKDPEYNISYGTKYFAQRLNWAKSQTSDPNEQYYLAFAAYNRPANPNLGYASLVNWQFQRFSNQKTG
ncbi:MAG: hypothetical protein COZ28_02320 [Candidatus Moranbacteria bacterium CG_4_10_14_3_um_filter_44_15]|nr:MAG: hypothetical protein COS72_01735 [Candidatus Moranbacteria bacterium CG06_land_8_20_14_3_00_43_56]PIV83857.1 MAG: hypothetical protein COW51_02535 [Candidatus Moranbacteria bacterium CG17_big_fil_post_rev_8_21_14_2_50_44_12]PIW93570.1 MAG: hypothetical protein COZ87_00495 [Candidatus Moranbacteria bacterium CG_4_8_14_3_um_filter_43_15]PIX90693.1 MAG: hypothetical protein COZ28_02320 [Candidatus Moranbacteria bacterium CG_4_10_14_3_um_filter_44_15]PJA86075.1 MAG: hypothetical protein CO1